MQSRYREVCGQLKSPHLFNGHTPDSMRTFSMLEWNWSELNPSLWQQERRGMCMDCQKVWSAEPGAINSPQLKHDGSPLPLPYRRTVLKPRSKWKGGNFLFLGPNQRAVTTIGYNSKEPTSELPTATRWSAVHSLQEQQQPLSEERVRVYSQQMRFSQERITVMVLQIKWREGPSEARTCSTAKGNGTRWMRFQMTEGKGHTQHTQPCM